MASEFPIRSQSIKILVRVLLIAASAILSYHLFFVLESYLRGVYSLVLFIILCGELIYHFLRMYRDYNYFLLGLLQNDFTTVFNRKKQEGSVKRFYATLNDITKKFRSMDIEKEAEHQFLEIIIDNISAGILVLDEENKIRLINSAFSIQSMCEQIHLFKKLEVNQPQLAAAIIEMQSGENRTVSVNSNGISRKITVHAKLVHLTGEKRKLIVIQDIQSELETQELESWNRLIRVLTHEIMNSISPISSLSETILKGLESETPISKDRIKEGIKAIHHRSEGLLRFTNTYRKLTRIPELQVERFPLSDILDRVATLLKPYFIENEVLFEFSNSKEPTEIRADREMLERVLINLIRNSVDATLDQPERASVQIRLHPNESREFHLLQVIDNGPGISDDLKEKIFVPFFTTKKEGSGIGLPVARQIIKKHGGRLEVLNVSKGTTINIWLKKM